MQNLLIEKGQQFVARLQNRDSLMLHSEVLDAISGTSPVYGRGGTFVERLEYPWPRMMKRAGFYTILNQEFIDLLAKAMHRRRLNTVPGIEICAGIGRLSYELNKRGMNLKPIDDGSDPDTDKGDIVERGINHLEALKKYNPRMVVGCWIPDDPQIGADVLGYPSVDFFVDIGESPPNATWLTREYENSEFKLMYWREVAMYAIGTSDYFYTSCRNNRKVVRIKYTDVRFWKRKGTPMSLDHRFDDLKFPLPSSPAVTQAWV